jgi:hypothetical protein
MRLIHVLGVAASIFLASQPANADQVVVQDHFNGSGLASHVPNTNVPGHAWSTTGSGATLSGQRAWAAGGDWAGILATIDTGVSDGMILVDWTPGGGDMPYGSIVARATDAANYIVAYYFSNTLYLYRIASGGNVLLASTAMPDSGTSTHYLKMVLAGSSITVFVDSVQRLSATDAFNIAATKHGFRWLSYYDWMSTYSTFEVDGVFVPTASTTSVTPASPAVPLFHSVTLTATAYDAGNNVIPNMSFSWSTSNSTAVSVAALTASTTFATGVGAGGATITATPLNGSGSTAAVTVNTGPVVVYDTFVGANSTALWSHAPEVNTASGTWSANGSGAFLSSNRATAGGADWNPITASIDAGIADGIVETDWTPGGLDVPVATIIARMSNSTNYLLAHYWQQNLWLYRVDNDHYTLLGQAAVADPGTVSHHLALKLAGSAIEVWWDGVQEIVASDAFNSTATRHGFRWYSWWDWLSTYERFEVSALPTIASVTVTPSTATIPMNGGRMLAAQALDAGGDPIPGVSFTWQSSNTGVVSTRVASSTSGAMISEGVGSATVTAVAFGGGAQGSASLTVTSPPPPPPPGCSGGVFPSGTEWHADGGIGEITLSAPSVCGWDVTANAPWIIPLQTSGTGEMVLTYAVDRNDTGSPRTTTIAVASATFTVTQTEVFMDPSGGSSGGGSGGGASSCEPHVSTFYVLVGSNGASRDIIVSGTAGCYATAVSFAPWATVSTSQGTDVWQTTVVVGQNPSSDVRVGVVVVGGTTVAIEQNGAGDDQSISDLVSDPNADVSHASFAWNVDGDTSVVYGNIIVTGPASPVYPTPVPPPVPI